MNFFMRFVSLSIILAFALFPTRFFTLSLYRVDRSGFVNAVGRRVEYPSLRRHNRHTFIHSFECESVKQYSYS